MDFVVVRIAKVKGQVESGNTHRSGMLKQWTVVKVQAALEPYVDRLQSSKSNKLIEKGLQVEKFKIPGYTLMFTPVSVNTYTAGISQITDPDLP